MFPFLKTFSEENTKYGVILETPERWSTRTSKNQKKYLWIPIASDHEREDPFNYHVFFTALNNAIKTDNHNNEPLFNISIKLNDKPYEEDYHLLSDRMKQLIIIYRETIELLTKELEKNDNEKYYAIQKEINFKKENKEQEEKKRDRSFC